MLRYNMIILRPNVPGITLRISSKEISLDKKISIFYDFIVSLKYIPFANQEDTGYELKQ